MDEQDLYDEGGAHIGAEHDASAGQGSRVCPRDEGRNHHPVAVLLGIRPVTMRPLETRGSLPFMASPSIRRKSAPNPADSAVDHVSVPKKQRDAPHQVK